MLCKANQKHKLRHTWRRPCKFGRLSDQICTAKRLKMLKNYQGKNSQAFPAYFALQNKPKTRVTPCLAAGGAISALKRPNLRRQAAKSAPGKNRVRFLLVLPYKTNRTQQLRHTWRWRQQRAGRGQRPAGPTFTEAARRRNPGTPQDLRSQNQPAGQSVPPGHHPWVVGPNPGV